MTAPWSRPWTRHEQINYATFGTREAPPEWAAVWLALSAFAKATGHIPGTPILDHFVKYAGYHDAASMSVD